jgi:hypothetical protein
MLLALWFPEADYYLALPVGFYEGYAFFCFYGMLAAFCGGEENLENALASMPGQARLYYPCGGQNLFGSVSVFSFRETKSLLYFLKGCVAQVMLVKPLCVVLMLFLSRNGYVDAANYCRLFAVASLWCVRRAGARRRRG